MIPRESRKTWSASSRFFYYTKRVSSISSEPFLVFTRKTRMRISVYLEFTFVYIMKHVGCNNLEKQRLGYKKENNMKNRKYLVTGATGFLGGTICRQLIEHL